MRTCQSTALEGAFAALISNLFFQFGKISTSEAYTIVYNHVSKFSFQDKLYDVFIPNKINEGIDSFHLRKNERSN
jgi:hypothetical protein